MTGKRKVPKYLASSADISNCGHFRYSLSRRLATGERTILFVGLNPSTADMTQDDPTIRRCVGFAREWGFDWLLMGNVYAYRSPNPKVLNQIEGSVGADNLEALKWMTRRAEIIVAAWGKNRLNSDAEALAKWILSLPHTRCLGQNGDGTPKHPLYLAKNTELRPLTLREQRGRSGK
jgi:hypothetical protein